MVWKSRGLRWCLGISLSILAFIWAVQGNEFEEIVVLTILAAVFGCVNGIIDTLSKEEKK